MSDPNLIPVDDALLGAYLAGETDRQETQAVEQWIAASPENRAHADALRRIWNEAPSVANLSQFDTDVAWQNVSTQLRAPKNNFRTFWRIAAAAAVVITIGLAGWFMLRDTAQPQVYSSTTNTTTIKLADGSTVTLNKNSKLTASATFGKEQREVTLEGEGFFEIAKDAAHPFIVHAGKLDVKVLGTAFNINARRTDSIMVTVEHGRVRCASASSDSVILQKGEAARFTASDNVVKKLDNGNRNAFAWKTHDFDFQATPLSEVAEQLNEVYGVRIVLKTEALKNCPVTIPSLHQKSLDYILNMLEATLGVTIQHQGELYVIDGLCKS